MISEKELAAKIAGLQFHPWVFEDDEALASDLLPVIRQEVEKELAAAR